MTCSARPRLTDGKSLELMHLLDKEYKSGVKEDLSILDKKVDARIAAVSKKMDERFEKVDERFDKIDARFEKVDARFQTIDDRLIAHDRRFDELDNKIDKKFDELDNKSDKKFVALDNKIDKKVDGLDNQINKKADELRIELRDTRVNLTHWMIGIILTIIGLFIAIWLKK